MSPSSRMRAMVIKRPGGPEVLELTEVSVPLPQQGQVQVRVRATALNRADLLQRRGLYPAPPGIPADIPGLEFSGEVEADLSRSSTWEKGQRVMGLLGGGGYAEYITAPADHLIAIPDHLSWTEAAAVPEAFLTAFDALVLQVGLKAGESVLIHAVASGVGSAALQIARALPALVIGTSRQSEKLKILQKWGLQHGIDTSRQRFLEPLYEITGGTGVDVVLDLVGGDQLAENLEALRLKGRLIVVGLVAGRSTTLDLGILLRKRILLKGTVLRSRSDREKSQLIEVFREAVVPLLASQEIQPIVDRVFNFEDAAAAHHYMESNQNVGKIVLAVS